MSEPTILHFDVEGVWFTWMLRHLWVEGSETKAVRMWKAAFPGLSTAENIKTIFLQLVSGQKKFTGWGSGEGFGWEDDGTKFWSPQARGEPSTSFPLLQSWEDVILLKRVNLFVSELELRSFRYYRRSPQKYEDAGFNSITWMQGAEENKAENSLLTKAGALWSEVMNLGMELHLDFDAFALPLDMKGWSTISYKGIPSRIVQMDVGTRLYQNIIELLDPIRDYFKSKYGTTMFYVDDDWIREFVCNISSYEEDAIMREGMTSRRREEIIETAQRMSGSSSLSELSVDKFIQQRMAQTGKPQEEDPFTTEWNSGYIDRQGKFYGCPDLDHVGFAGDVVEHLGIQYKAKKKARDLQYVLDDKGWVKVSALRFYYEKRPTRKQRDAIGLFMTGKGMTEALFNKQFGKGVSFEEWAISEGE